MGISRINLVTFLCLDKEVASTINSLYSELLPGIHSENTMNQMHIGALIVTIKQMIESALKFISPEREGVQDLPQD